MSMPCRLCSCVLPTLLVVGAASLVAASTLQDERPPGNAAAQAGPVNTSCPFSGKPVGSDSPRVEYKGQIVGFCCNGCRRRWEGLDEPEQQVILANFVPPTTAVAPRATDGLAVARAYIQGMESGGLDAMNELFLPGERSSILENASDEGSWEHYRDHHLKPEMESTTSFKFTVADESEQRFGSATLVRQVGSFTILAGEEQRGYRAAVSYLMVEDAGDLKIAHLHWSSRPKRK